ncbi:PAS domain S-box-containing protein [Syntrophus gentianae]|uniref:histidine kinase n=1 Tax=Syntrophus gentianae TaxID=43775 RepID=A0A1H8B0F5_9BACT|nr:PAS domain S-box protein [Syntrophus gentianae]SEM76405.1 PAS domain S-box-containing protein [Syntrophus gentianae]
MNYGKMTKSQLIEKIEELSRRNLELESCKVISNPQEPDKGLSPGSLFAMESDAKELELAEIVDIPAIQSIMSSFHELAPTTWALVDLKGNVLISVGWQDICVKYHRVHPETCRFCNESDVRLSTGVAFGEYKLYKCMNNLWDVATPIIVGGRHIGNLFSGQFIFEDERVDYDFFRFQARRYGFPEEEYIAALDSLPRLSRPYLDKILTFFMRLAQVISQLSYSNIRLTCSLEEKQALMTSLRANEEKYRDIFDNALGGIYRTTPEGRFLDANPALAHIFGYNSPEELMNLVSHVGKQLHVDPEGRKRFVAFMEEQDYAHHEAQIRRKDGDTCWVRFSGRAVRDTEGNTLHYEGFCEDITERKRAEEELSRYRNQLEELVKERTFQLEENNRLLISEIAERKRIEEALRISEDNYRTIFENTGNATLIFEEDTTISLVNTEFVNLFKYSREETEGRKSWTELVPKEDLDWMMDNHRWRKIDPESVPNKYELKVVDRKGSIHDVYLTVAMIPDTGKRVASIMDVTPLKKTEKALAQNEALYRNLYENAPFGMFQAAFDSGRLLGANAAYANMLGYQSPEELMSSIAEIASLHVDPKDQSTVLATLKQQDWFYGEYPRFRKDGSIMFGKVAIRRVLKPNGTIDVLEGIVEDVTEQRRAEEELKKYVEEIRDLYENAPCGYHSFAEDGTILRMNDTELSWLGYSRDEVIGKMKISDLLTSEAYKVLQNDRNILKKRGWLRDIESTWIRKDGSFFDVLVNVTAVYDEKGKYLANRCSAFDNTERKGMEDALVANEALYRNLFENASIGMFQSTLEGKFLRINKTYATMLGYDSPEEVLSTITDTSTQIHADSRNRDELLAALEDHGWFYTEQPYLRKDGSIMIGQLAVRKVDKQGGATPYLEGIVEDITERKRAEEALIKRERELRIQAKNLMEVNTTLKVLLNTMEKDQEEFKERFLTNIKDQVLPHLDRLKKRPLPDVEKSLVKMAENSLDEIASPFVQKLNSNYLKLTKKELQIATLIKEGKTSKEIAELLNSKKRVIEFHRENIREKLGLKNKKENLAILLRSFS